MKTRLRFMKEIGMDERRDILLELQVEGSLAVAQKHSTTMRVIQHIRFFHGKKTQIERPGKKAYHHKYLLEGAQNPLIDRVTALKKKELTSVEVSEKLGVDLETINKVWAFA